VTRGGLRRTATGAARQLADLAVVLVVASALAYALVLLAPGDAASSLAQQRAGAGATAQQIAAIRKELGLDDPGPAQYARWATHALTGDLGISARTGRPIATEIVPRVGVTALLALLAALVALPIGMATGIAGAVLPAGFARGTLRAGAVLGVSLPNFWLSYLLILVLAEAWGVVPTSGQGCPATYLMPVAVLALPAAGLLSRIVAVTMREALDQPYVVAAKARGATPWAIVLRDALPNAAGPILSTAGLIAGNLLIGTIVVEVVFSWSGIGDYFLEAVSYRDITAIQACVLFFAGVFVVVNRLADAAHAAVDPRVALRQGD
jgi:peptide/nickel transport system permease protein